MHCGTSVPSERMFSLAGHITNGRSRLLPEDLLNETCIPWYVTCMQKPLNLSS